MDQNLKDIINQYTQYLKPIRAFDKTMSYGSFSKPMETYIQGAVDTYKPWYEYFQASPQKQQMAGGMASRGTSRTGWGKNVAQRSLRELYQPMYNQMDQTKEQFRRGWVTPLYQQRIKKYYQSPTSGTNLKF